MKFFKTLKTIFLTNLLLWGQSPIPSLADDPAAELLKNLKLPKVEDFYRDDLPHEGDVLHLGDKKFQIKERLGFGGFKFSFRAIQIEPKCVGESPCSITLSTLRPEKGVNSTRAASSIPFKMKFNLITGGIMAKLTGGQGHPHLRRELGMFTIPNETQKVKMELIVAEYADKTAKDLETGFIGSNGISTSSIDELRERSPSLLSKIENKAALQTRILAEQMVEAIRELEYNDVVHNDIKPSNILVIGHESPKTTDLQTGEARFALADFDTQTRKGSIAQAAGTPQYMAPEIYVLTQSKLKSHPVQDLWSLSATLYDLNFGLGAMKSKLNKIGAATKLPELLDVKIKDPLFRGLFAIAMDLEVHAQFRQGIKAQYDARIQRALELGDKKGAEHWEVVKRVVLNGFSRPNERKVDLKIPINSEKRAKRLQASNQKASAFFQEITKKMIRTPPPEAPTELPRKFNADDLLKAILKDISDC